MPHNRLEILQTNFGGQSASFRLSSNHGSWIMILATQGIFASLLWPVSNSVWSSLALIICFIWVTIYHLIIQKEKKRKNGKTYKFDLLRPWSFNNIFYLFKTYFWILLKYENFLVSIWMDSRALILRKRTWDNKTILLNFL